MDESPTSRIHLLRIEALSALPFSTLVVMCPRVSSTQTADSSQCFQRPCREGKCRPPPRPAAVGGAESGGESRGGGGGEAGSKSSQKSQALHCAARQHVTVSNVARSFAGKGHSGTLHHLQSIPPWGCLQCSPHLRVCVSLSLYGAHTAPGLRSVIAVVPAPAAGFVATLLVAIGLEGSHLAEAFPSMLSMLSTAGMAPAGCGIAACCSLG